VLLLPQSVRAKCFKESAEKNVSNCSLLEFEDQVDINVSNCSLLEFEDQVDINVSNCSLLFEFVLQSYVY